MVENYGSMNERFPILDGVIKNLSCADTEKALLKDLFATIYRRLGYGDRQGNR